MILAWLAARPLWLRYAIPVALIILLMLAVAWFKGREEADDTRNQTIGATVEREQTQAATITRTEQGNAARGEIQEAITHDDGRSRAVYDECLRSARTPANCERYAVSK